MWHKSLLGVFKFTMEYLVQYHCLYTILSKSVLKSWEGHEGCWPFIQFYQCISWVFTLICLESACFLWSPPILGPPTTHENIFKTARPLLQNCPSFLQCPATEPQNLTILFGRQQLSLFKDQALGRARFAFPVTKWDGLAFTAFPGGVITANVIWIFVVF